mgnify:CR=1 FL=1
MAEEANTAPMVKSARIKRNISIQEINEPPAPTTFDTTAVYPSDALPEWFAGLQSIVEDETFTSMAINIGRGKVYYRITIAIDEALERVATILGEEQYYG